MANFTTNFNLKKPLGGEVYNIEDFNGNMDILDGAVPIVSGSNTGDETLATIKTKLGISTLSGSNTGDQTLPTLSSLGGAPLASPTFTGTVTAPTNTAYTTRQVRNVVLSTADASGGSNGDIWFKYTP